MSNWGWPQIIMAILMGLSLLITLLKDGEPQKPHDFKSSLIASLLSNWLLWAGGFWS
jgi:hypothetical protein